MGKAILIVDDSKAIRQSMSFVLEQAGYAVTQAEDGQDALGKLQAGTFQLIVTDVNMPNMDGIALTKAVRADGPHKFTPILILTTESQEEKMKEGKTAGATGWIVKPFESDKLVSVVGKLIN